MAISDLYASQRGDPRLTYRLLIRREQPDYRLVLLPNSANATDAVTVRAGGRTSAYVLAIRLDGFTGPIRVEAAELPPGVTLAPVVIGPGQVLAPVVFEAADDAATGLGTVSLVGHTRFGDRKEDLSSVAGAATTGQDMTRRRAGRRDGLAARGAAVPTVAPARLFRGFLVAVRGEPAPLTLTARPESLVVAQGHKLDLEMTVARRAGFVEAVAVTSPELPPQIAAATVTIAKEAKAGVLPLFVPKNVPPGTYSFVRPRLGPLPVQQGPEGQGQAERHLDRAVEPDHADGEARTGGPDRRQQGRRAQARTEARDRGDRRPPERLRRARDPRPQRPGELQDLGRSGEPCQGPGQGQARARGRQGQPRRRRRRASSVRAVAEVRGEKVEVDEPVALTIGK